MNHEGQTIIARLESLRQTARRRLFLYGLFAVLGGGLIAFLTVLALDWFLWLPPALRIIGLALFVGGFFGAIIHWVIRPLQAALSVEAIAARLEDRFAPLRDHLRSTVDFLQHEDSGSRPMMERVIRQTESELHRLPLESIFSLRPLAARALWLTLGVSALAIVVLAAPSWFGMGLRRYLSPLGDAEWPRTVNIEPMTGDLLVAAGDAAIVRMKVTRGWNDSLRALVHFSDSANEPGRLTLQDQGGGLFEASIDPVNADLSYWFEAGDADTMRRPSVIRVVRRPTVAEAVALIEPPPYAKRVEPKRQDLAEGPIRATVGGKVTLQVKSSKPIPEQVGKSAAGLRLATDEWVPLELDAGTGTYSTTWDVRENVEFRVELRDEHGFENRGAPQHFLTVVEDVAPTVTMWEPKSQLELTPKGSLRLVARVDDDFGLDSVTLSAEKSPSDEQFSWSLTDRLRPFDSDTGVAFVSEHTLPMGAMNAAPGDSITYHLTATDNRMMDDLSSQVGRGPLMRVRVISEVEFEIRLRDDVAMLETKLRQVMVDQSELADRTSSFVQTGEPTTDLTAAERDAVSSTAAAQSRLGRRLGEVAKRFRELAERVEANQPGDKETAGQLAALGGAMLQLANGGMANAGEALQDASERSTSDEQQKQLRIARQKQELAVSQLQASIRSMSQWGNFQGLVTRTRDLMERQDALRNKTTDLGQQTLGKSVQDLSSAEAAALKRLQRQQEQLAGDVEQLLDRMNQLQAASKEKDPASAESIDAALRAAAARDVTTHARQAVDALSSNRTAAASIEQKAALDALNKMASVLQEREARELAQLRKRIDKAEEQVAQLLREQEALRKATKEAGDVAADANALTILEQEQHALRRNTGAVGESIGELAVASSVVRLIRQSVNPMTRAEQGLRERAIPDALVHQDEAIKSLEEALEILHELAEQSAREEMRRTLTQIRENLEAMAAAQKTVNDGLATVRTAIVAQQGRIGRAEAREITRLARAQAGVREMCETLRPDFEQVMVYRWAMDRVATWMDDARAAFDSRSVDDRLNELTRRILQELERLAAAVLDTEKLPLDSEFVEAQSGDGGSGPSEQQNVPVPPMTELLVLKSLQVELLGRTKAMSDLVAGGTANEAQLRELKGLGEDQAELRRLTEIVTRQSRGR